MNKETKTGYIYSLTCNNPNLIYYGSTTKKLKYRLTGHKALSNTCESKILFNWGNVKINLLEEIEFEDKQELLDREAYYIRNLKCINKIIPGRTNKEWYIDNKELTKERSKKRYRENKDKLNKQYKEWYIKNKEKILLQKKEYNKIKINCDCGSKIRQGALSKHKETQKHKVYEFLKEIEESNIKL